MSYFKTDTDELRMAASGITKASNKLSGYSRSLESISASLSIEGSTKALLQRKIKEACRRMDKNGQNGRKMGQVLSDIALEYDNTEKKVATMSLTPGAIIDNGPGSFTNPIGPWLFWPFKNADFIEKFLSFPFLIPFGSGLFTFYIPKIMTEYEFTGPFGTNNKLTFETWAKDSSFKVNSGLKWKQDEKTGKMKLDSISLLEAEAKGSLALLSTTATLTKGIFSNEAKADVGKVSGKGKVGISLVKDGKISPQANINLEATAVGVEATDTLTIGKKDGNFNGEIKATGTVGKATAKAEGGIGVVRYTDDSGKERKELGVKGEVKAEAYALEGRVGGGVSIFGIKFDVGVTGKAGGAGVSAGGSATTGGVSGKIGAGLGLGAALDFNIDWSGCKLFKKK